MNWKVWAICFNLILTIPVLYAQERKIEPYQVLSIDDGLAHNGVTSICEDSRGYLWFGTYDGLNRYDGYEFKVYKNTPTRKLFVSNRIRSIIEDKRGNLWLGTDEGISIYHYSKEKFENLNDSDGENLVKSTVRNFLINNEGEQVIGLTEGEGLLFFQQDYTFLKQFIPGENIYKNSVLFYEGIVLDKSNYFFTTNAGLLHFNFETQEFTKIADEALNQHNSLIRLKDDILLATTINGLILIEVEKNTTPYKYKISKLKGIQGQFRKAAVDGNNRIWLSDLQRGIIQLDKSALIQGKVKIKSVFQNKQGLFRASDMHINDNTGCWITTFNKGIYRFNNHENPFYSSGNQSNFDLNNRSRRTTLISTLDKNRFFVTAQGAGLSLYNSNTNKFENLPEYLSRINKPELASVFVDSKKDLWLYYNNANGLCRIRANSNKLEKVSELLEFPEELGQPKDIAEDDEGNIWFVDLDDVFKLNLDENREVLGIEFLENNPFFEKREAKLFRSIYIDSEHELVWIGTDTDGLFRLSYNQNQKLEEVTIKQFTHNDEDGTSIPSNFISCITRLASGDLWIGTERGGICKVIRSTEENPEFVTFTEDDGLSNNVVKSILSDNQQNLWISTNIGLNKFDTKNNLFRTFKKDNGLPFEDFFYSSEKLANGNIVVSGLNGFCYFNPKDIPAEEELPKLDFNNFRILNKVVTPGDSISKRVILAKRLAETDAISLKYNENVFSLELTSLHYSTPENHFLRYQLSPNNTEWIVVPSTQRTINYNGLQPGEYELKVMASNSLNEWTAPKTLKISITPPFWKTIPAYVLYALALGLIIYSIMYYILRMNRLQHNLEIEHLEKENVKEVNAAKLRFFSNISHEIKTPLTLISGPIELMTSRYKGNVDLANKLQIVRRQSKKIWQLVDQVHDFQRSDANKLKMNNSQFCINDFLNEMVIDFRFLAETEKKNFEVQFPDELVYVTGDKDKMEKIFNNLLNNAFKYTKPDDTITLHFNADGKNLLLEVSDTGRGIAADDLPHIFERFYQSQHKHSEYTGGSGIGLAFTQRLVEMQYGYIGAESVLGRGSKFLVKLPVVIPKPESSETTLENNILSAEQNFDQQSQVTDKIDFSKIQIGENIAEAKIFVAEDNSEMRSFIDGVLSNFFKVKSYSNGQELATALLDEWPDIIVSDVLMPEMNGFDLCKHVKADIKTSHIPIILLTACTTIEEQLKGLKVGADSYITKPFDIQHLVTRIETLLQNKQRISERYKIDFPLTLEKNDSSEKDMAFLEKLYNLMDENLDNTDLDMDKFAKKLYLNRTHFFQKVKAITNQTPYELLKMYRLKRAAELLVQNKLSVNEVYLMTGFKSRSNFSKLFKEKYNCSPGKYASDVMKES